MKLVICKSLDVRSVLTLLAVGVTWQLCR